ncbi:metal-dependent phosphohydrolase HD sub domain [Ruminiclostridium papyrosolvens DSM 2782]|uniref:Metal-dependent phosphohydrolase HD sub domain n=1 Tax=Ruminiclostridium papyrosolvens DSM 2782 TaxID=588581 RepID=F1T9S7_9FIRM|nr:HD domain-containing protein [Ruminiclostridium papyrosolvens]EGD48669.1 metal-dependent phosphohydrolase HD sub domain [Ruminiclostridium papyrosolvens DSM 2782]WES32573.1 HD domain-containing protein [Ruminiclostridium papyrosolvens DSM 2782]
MVWRQLREQQENLLSPYAARSVNSFGRIINEEKCPIRTDYERDGNRILYSMEFRRLRHKTQVFFNAKNDHICTRMEHVLNVGSIAVTIARTLNLNQDLTYAIALGHDLGHAPFGHSGERVLDKCMKKVNKESGFKHELHSLRVVEKLATRISKEKIHERCGLNLTFEVKDGIVSHCGEKYNEYSLRRDMEKTPQSLLSLKDRGHLPFTLEACIVRLVDKIAYVGRDIEDAVRVNLMNMHDIPMDIRNELGNTNGEIINTLVCDLVENSYGRDCIQLSTEKGQALEKLINENVRLIYKADKITRYEKIAENTLEGLFDSLRNSLSDFERLQTNENKVYRMFYNFIADKAYDKSESDAQKVIDFIAGMTDQFAQSCFEEIYWM